MCPNCHVILKVFSKGKFYLTFLSPLIRICNKPNFVQHRGPNTLLVSTKTDISPNLSTHVNGKFVNCMTYDFAIS